MLKVVSWNIERGGAVRVDLVGERLSAHDPDIIVLNEYWPTRSKPVLDLLAGRGWRHIEPRATRSSAPGHPGDPAEGGLIVLSKLELEPQPIPPALRPFSNRYLSAAVPGVDLQIRALYGPPKRGHQEFWDAVLVALQADAGNTTLIIGDFNTGEPRVDSPATSI